MEYGYIRLSSKEQNVGRQLDAFSKMKLDRKNIFIDKQSGKDFERPSYRIVRYNCITSPRKNFILPLIKGRNEINFPYFSIIYILFKNYRLRKYPLTLFDNKSNKQNFNIPHTFF
ncbi:MAG: recombinase family protein [Clostridia bacterium]|nr:recombinase family protein [Clostridia bacterium]